MQIKEYICTHIESGIWPINFQIPSESTLMEKFSVSRMTVNRALKELVIEGIIYRKKGKGSFVRGKIPREKLLEIHDIEEEIRGRGSSYFSAIKYLSQESDSPLTIHVFGANGTNKVFRSKIIHYENGMPLQLEDRYINGDIISRYLEVDFKKISTHHYLMGVAPLQKGEVQQYLQIQATEPCLLLKRKTWSNDQLISYTELTYPGSRYSFGGGWIIQSE